jgi:hypothetical protein
MTYTSRAFPYITTLQVIDGEIQPPVTVIDYTHFPMFTQEVKLTGHPENHTVWILFKRHNLNYTYMHMIYDSIVNEYNPIIQFWGHINEPLQDINLSDKTLPPEHFLGINEIPAGQTFEEWIEAQDAWDEDWWYPPMNFIHTITAYEYRQTFDSFTLKFFDSDHHVWANPHLYHFPHAPLIEFFTCSSDQNHVKPIYCIPAQYTFIPTEPPPNSYNILYCAVNTEYLIPFPNIKIENWSPARNPYFIDNDEGYIEVTPSPDAATTLFTNHNIQTRGIIIAENVKSH